MTHHLRPAILSDAEDIAKLGMDFIGKLKLSARPSVDSVTDSVKAMLGDDRGCGLVFFVNGELKGFLLGIAVPIWFDMSSWSAIELAWWVDPEHRGSKHSVQMVKMFEQWAANMNVSRVVLSDIEFEDQAQPAGALIERLGYTLHERAFVKVI